VLDPAAARQRRVLCTTLGARTQAKQANTRHDDKRKSFANFLNKGVGFMTKEAMRKLALNAD
jgi:hypothetical protein